VIALIRAAKNPGRGREGLITQFSLSQIQAQAILDMQLQRLTGLERQKILDELAELLKVIRATACDLSSDRLVMQIIIDELNACARSTATTAHRDPRGRGRVPPRGPDRRGRYGDHRQQHRLHQADRDHELPQPAPRRQGRIGMRTREEDFRQPSLRRVDARLHHDLLDRGRAYWLKVYEIPDVGPDGRGKAIANLVSMEEGERIASMIAVKEFEADKFVVMGTRHGVVKKTELAAFQQPAPAASSRWVSRRVTP